MVSISIRPLVHPQSVVVGGLCLTLCLIGCEAPSRSRCERELASRSPATQASLAAESPRCNARAASRAPSSSSALREDMAIPVDSRTVGQRTISGAPPRRSATC